MIPYFKEKLIELGIPSHHIKVGYEYTNLTTDIPDYTISLKCHKKYRNNKRIVLIDINVWKDIVSNYSRTITQYELFKLKPIIKKYYKS